MNGRPAIAPTVLIVAVLLLVPIRGTVPAETTGHTGSHGEDLALVHPSTSDRTYSLFMHHTAGLGVLVIGALLLADRVSVQKSRLLGGGIGLLWISVGSFLFMKADPEGWPIGPATFRESLTMPTAIEWVQHKALSLIPMLFGVGFFATRFGTATWPRRWTIALAVASVLGAVGLLWHQHASHPGMDLVNVQHRLFAATALFIATAFAVEDWDSLGWPHKNLMFPTGLFMLGLQLILFEE